MSGGIRDHLVIRASAGSGKTYRLSSRYIAILRSGAEPRAILATTFTRKAAGEILERVMRRLAEAAADPKKAAALGDDIAKETGTAAPLSQAEAAALLRKFCTSLHQVSISTIDAFFSRVVRCFQPELGLPRAIEMTDEKSPRASALRQSAINALLEEKDFTNATELLCALNKGQRSRSVTEKLDEVLAETYEIFQDSGAERWEGPGVEGAEISGDEQARLADALADLADRYQRIADANKTARPREKDTSIHGGWPGDMRSHHAMIVEGRWSEMAKKDLFFRVLHGDVSMRGKPLPEEAAAIYRALAGHVAWEVTSGIRAQTQAMRDFLARYTAHIEAAKHAERLLFFSDLPRILGGGAIDGAAAPSLPEIAYRLDARIGHILLDEFQDTAPAQWNVLRPLAEEVVASGPPSATSRSFFCVGDVKQAIYGWRGGRSAIFDRLKSDLHLEKEEKLNKSYRSSPFVLDAVNELFLKLPENGALLEQEECEHEPQGAFRGFARAWHARFERHESSQPELDGYVELATSTPGRHDEDDAEARALAEGRANDEDSAEDEEREGTATGHDEYVARKVAALVREHPDGSIGILTRSRKAATVYLSLLRRLGIAASGESGNPIYIEPLVSVILAALKLADHPGDTAAAGRLAWSPLGERYAIAIGDAAPIRAATIRAASRRLRDELEEHGLAAMVADWARVLVKHADPAGIASSRLERIIELAESWTPTTPHRWVEFIETIETTRIDEVLPSQVRIMTIHASKGLEFDIVVLPELTPTMVKVQKAVCTARDAAGDAIHSVHGKRSFTEMRFSAEARTAFLAEAAREYDDSLCSLYVAMTRARQALFLILPPVTRNAKGKTGTKGVSNNTWASLLRRGLSQVPLETERTVGDEILYSVGNRAWTKPAAPTAPREKSPPAPVDAIQLKKSAGPPRRWWPEVTPSSLAHTTAATRKGLFTLERSAAMDRGILIHRWFQEIEWLEQFTLDDETLKRLARATVPGIREETITETLTRFRAAMKSDAVRTALSRPNLQPGETATVWRERAFAVKHDHKLLHGQFDRVVIVWKEAKPVRAMLVDFKSDAVADANQLAEREAHYAPQIAEYRRALEMMLTLPAEAIEDRLVFLAR